MVDPWIERYATLLECEFQRRSNGSELTAFNCTGKGLPAFAQYAKERGLRYGYENARQLIKRLSNDIPLLEKQGWEVEMGFKFGEGESAPSVFQEGCFKIKDTLSALNALYD